MSIQASLNQALTGASFLLSQNPTIRARLEEKENKRRAEVIRESGKKVTTALQDVRGTEAYEEAMEPIRERMYNQLLDTGNEEQLIKVVRGRAERETNRKARKEAEEWAAARDQALYEEARQTYEAQKNHEAFVKKVMEGVWQR